MSARPELRTRTAVVADHLRNAILSGDFQAGAPLKQADVAKQLGVSTTPVREAFVLLLQEGLLDSDPHKGMTVIRPTRAELLELWEIRGPLEGLAAAKAADHVTDEDIAKLSAMLDEMAEIPMEDDGNGGRVHYQDVNRRFHATINDLAHMPRLAALILQLRDQSRVYLRLASTALPRHPVEEQHAAIVDALRRRNGKAADKAVRRHLQHTADHIASEFPEDPPEAL